MKIKITSTVSIIPKPEIGKTYEVKRIKEKTCNENVYFVEVNGKEVGILGREMEIVER